MFAIFRPHRACFNSTLIIVVVPLAFIGLILHGGNLYGLCLNLLFHELLTELSLILFVTELD